MSSFLPWQQVIYYSILATLIFLLFHQKFHSIARCGGIALGLTSFISEFWEIPIFIKGNYGYMNILNQVIVTVAFVLALALCNFQLIPKLLQLPLTSLLISFILLSIPIYLPYWGWITRFSTAILLTAWVYFSRGAMQH